MNEPTSDLLDDATGRAIRYRARRRNRPVFPDRALVDRLDQLDGDLPDRGRDGADVLRLLDEVGSPATVASTGGRYFGFVTGGTEPVALAASILAAAWDQNTARPEMSPAATRIDAIVARWIVDLLGLPAGSTAAFCSGASVANLTAILAARDALLARAGWDVEADGLTGAPPIEVVASTEVHVSVLKALRAAGIGRSAVTLVETDDRGRLRVDALPPLGDRSLVVAQAGNVNTGHSDPFDQIRHRLGDDRGWLHVDGAFGLWAAASPRHRTLVAGVERADSWATDAHKWLNVPYDSGLAICARAEDLRRAMAIDAPYLAATPGSGQGPDRVLMDLGLQMSQRARAVEAFAVLASRGRSGIARLVATGCDQAALLAQRLAAGGAEILAPVVLNQVLVAFGDDDTTDAVIAAVQRDGTCWAGGTTWQGRRAMRLSVSDSATTDDDVEASAAAILACRSGIEPGR